MIRALAFLALFLIPSPAHAYKEFNWMLNFNNASGVNCLGSKTPSCTTSCHWDEAQQISLEIAQSSGLGSIILMTKYDGHGVPVIVNAVYPTKDKHGTAWITAQGCLFVYTGG